MLHAEDLVLRRQPLGQRLPVQAVGPRPRLIVKRHQLFARLLARKDEFRQRHHRQSGATVARPLSAVRAAMACDFEHRCSSPMQICSIAVTFCRPARRECQRAASRRPAPSTRFRQRSSPAGCAISRSYSPGGTPVEPKPAVGLRHLIARMIEHKNPGPHRAVKHAADCDRLPRCRRPDRSGTVWLPPAGMFTLKLAMSLDDLHVVRRLVAVGELDRVAPADRHGLRQELKILLVDHHRCRPRGDSLRQLLPRSATTASANSPVLACLT